MKRFSLLGLLLFFLLNTLNAQDVYVGSKKSDKYHKPDCKWAQKIKPENKVVFKDKIRTGKERTSFREFKTGKFTIIHSTKSSRKFQKARRQNIMYLQ